MPGCSVCVVVQLWASCESVVLCMTTPSCCCAIPQWIFFSSLFLNHAVQTCYIPGAIKLFSHGCIHFIVSTAHAHI